MSKYGAKPQVIDNIRFHSQKEARRYQELKLLAVAGELHGIRLQPRFELSVFQSGQWGGVVIGKYLADFEYCTCRRDPCARSRLVVEDVKGFKTPLYKWKKKHVEAQYGIEIRET